MGLGCSRGVGVFGMLRICYVDMYVLFSLVLYILNVTSILMCDQYK